MYADTCFSILALEAGLHPERFARPASASTRPAESGKPAPESKAAGGPKK
jgi:hypothetical protein